MEAPRTKSKSKSNKKIKKSGVRTKFLIESLRNDYYSLREENDILRSMVEAHLPPADAQAILATCFDANAPKAKVGSIDSLAEQMANAGVDDDDDDAVGF